MCSTVVPPDFVVVVPCLNESANISRCLDSILAQDAGLLRGRVVVVDNGSVDGTIELVRSYGRSVRLMTQPGLSISELRNLGARSTSSGWLVFVDADVEVSEAWLSNLRTRISELAAAGGADCRAVIGSTYLAPEHTTWIEDLWFAQLAARDSTARAHYINGGNLALSRQLFEEIGGFDPGCPTGEDVKFCRDAVQRGAHIVREDGMAAVHHGYPRSASAFFKRELWHGKGMIVWLRQPWKSRPLALCLFNLALAATAVSLAGLHPSRAVEITFVAGSLWLCPLALLAARRLGRCGFDWVRLTFLYAIYSMARTIALLSAIGRR